MSRHAFSLVELSIVLVILGLLTGGILTGQNLIRAAELRSVTTEYQAYQTATNTFRDKYFQLPGDMNNAIDFWGAAHATPATCLTTTGTGTQTCDGDGDGVFDNPAAASQYGEIFTFFQHLANAGLIEGSFTGIAGTGAAINGNINTNIPSAKLGNAGWSVLNIGNIVNTSLIYYEGSYGNALIMGTKTASDLTTSAALSAEEAWNIDTKVDDGSPGLGGVRTYESQGSATAGSGCGNAAAAATDLAATVAYDLTNTSAACAMIFKM